LESRRDRSLLARAIQRPEPNDPYAVLAVTGLRRELTITVIIIVQQIQHCVYCTVPYCTERQGANLCSAFPSNFPRHSFVMSRVPHLSHNTQLQYSIRPGSVSGLMGPNSVRGLAPKLSLRCAGWAPPERLPSKRLLPDKGERLEACSIARERGHWCHCVSRHPISDGP
jgi:hypothetical protein